MKVVGTYRAGVRWLLGAVIVSLLVGFPAAGAAQEAGVDRTAAARALFEEGLQLLYDEQWEPAADRFQRALELRPSPQVVYNLTTALMNLGRLVRASELLQTITLDPTASADVREAAEARRRELTTRIPTLSVSVTGDLTGAALFLDELPIADALVGVAFPVDPGRHVVTARLRSVDVAEATIVLDEGEQRELVLGEPESADDGQAPVSTGPGEPEPRRPHRSVARQWWFWTIIGTVVVSGAVTAGVLATRDREVYADPVPGLGGTIIVGGEQ